LSSKDWHPPGARPFLGAIPVVSALRASTTGYSSGKPPACCMVGARQLIGQLSLDFGSNTSARVLGCLRSSHDRTKVDRNGEALHVVEQSGAIGTGHVVVDRKN
jgi:hypothetical protein